MKNLTKRSLSWVLVVALCISLMSGLAMPVAAATYEYNWGTRGVTATSPSSKAEAFYTGSYTFDALMQLSGSSSGSASTVAQSELYDALQDLMRSNHSYTNSYKENNNLLKYTDCQGGGGAISSFYSGTAIGPDWSDQTPQWNKEHTWPNSKGLNGSDEDDVMMIRPSVSAENSARGNKAYGESSGYYDPNDTSNGQLNLHGDVARIMLYIYVRWGNTNLFGSEGVLESKELMLEWIAEDPVDTWELGRVDAVQSITGTRNVFVDYPELAFQLFGESVPAGMTTPSGGSGSGSSNPVVLTYSENGQTRTFDTFEGNTTTLAAPTTAPADGWDFLGWTTTALIGTQTNKPATIYAPGDSYRVPTGGATLYALYTRFDGNGEPNAFTLTDSLSGGEKVVMYNAGSGKAVDGVITGSYYLTATAVTPDDDKIVTTDSSLTWDVTKNPDGTFTFTGNGGTLSMNWNTSSQKTSMTLDGANPKMVLTSCNADNKSYYVYVSGVTGKYEHIWLEFFNSRFTAYDTSADRANEGAFGIQFYAATGAEYYATTTAAASKYDVSFSTPSGITAPGSVTSDALGFTLPTAAAPEGWSFAGWVTETVEPTATEPAVIYKAGETYSPSANITLKALYVKGGSAITRVTDASTLTAGTQLIIGNAANSAVAGPMAGTYLSKLDATYATDGMTITTLPADALIFTLGGSAGAWTLDTASGSLAVTSGSNNKLSWTHTNKIWTITITDGVLALANTAGRPDALYYNVGSPRFSNYNADPNKTTSVPVELYLAPTGATYTTNPTAPACEHSYTAQTVSEDTKKSDATCLSPAVYYCSCANCGQLPEDLTGAATFTSGTAKAHSYTVPQKDATHHWNKCATCDAIDTKVAHEYDIPMTSGTHHWNECECGAEDTRLIHNYNIPVSDDDQHWNACICGVTDTKVTHSYTIGYSDNTYHWNECACGKSEPKVLHSFTLPQKDATHHWNECSCGVADTKVAHSYTIAKSDDTHHWTECACGAADTKVAHSYTIAKSDNAHHWNECACGAADTKVPHSFNLGMSNDTHHWNECACGAADTKVAHSYTVAKSDETHHWNECACGAADTKVAHSYTIAKSDDTHHWNACSCGAADTKVPHSYTTAKYNTTYHWNECECGKADTKAAHTFSTAASNATHHWLECADCDYAEEQVPHSYTIGKSSDTHHWNECACGAADTKVAHSYTAPKKDDTHHWNECTCGAADTKVAHSYTAPKKDAAHHWNECACGAADTEVAHSYTTPQKDATHHWNVCSCGAADTKVAHSYTVAKSDNTYHWNECTCGAADTKVAHSYTAPKKDDTHHWNECTCGAADTKVAHSYTAPKKDDTHHWSECTCGAADIKVAHNFSVTKANADQHWTECACGAATAPADHDFVSKHNAEQHWLGCECGTEKGSRADHLGGEATCTDPGKCDVCQAPYIDALGHVDAEEIPQVSATCTKPGVKKHYHCDVCDGDYLTKDAAAAAQTADDLKLPVDPAAHPEGKLAHVAAVAPTKEAEGMKEHWLCADCGKYFSDAAGKNEVTKASLVLPKVGTPATGDATPVVLMIVLLVLSAACAAVLVFAKKRRTN